MPDRIYLSSPHLSGNELPEIERIFGENWVAPVGPDLEAFEKNLALITGATDCCAVHSATAALHLALRLLEVKEGDLVFVQSHNHIGCVNPIIYQGAVPVFIDSEPGTWNMCPKHLERAIQTALSGKLSPDSSSTSISGPHTLKAIVPVHLYGMPANLDVIFEVAEKYGLPVVEDAAESLGSTYSGRHTGSLGRMGIYSFNGNKIVTTGGGGALVSDDKSLMERARFLATQAREAVVHFQHTEVGYNYRLSNVLAGIGCSQLKVLQERIAQRRGNFERYRQYFSRWNRQGYDIRFQEEQEGSFSNRWLTCILVDPQTNNGLTREDIRLELAGENIEARPLWKPMHLQPVFAHYPFFGDGTAESLFNQGLCLPSGSNLTEADFNRIFSVMDRIFDSRE